MATSVLTSKGQTTIPKAVREHLGLAPGARIDFEIRPSGEVVLKPATRDIRTLAGILYRPEQRRVSLEEMEAAICHHRSS